MYSGLNWAVSSLIDKMTVPIQAGGLENGAEMDLEFFKPFMVDEDPSISGPIQFSRPIILTPHFNKHLTLMVIQYDKEQKITATVLDSLPWKGKEDDNQQGKTETVSVSMSRKGKQDRK